MKRIFKIILILIVAFLLILGIVWLIGRNKALKNGNDPLTFRQFLGLSTKKDAAKPATGEGSSEFNGDGSSNNGNGNGNGSGDINTDGSGGIGINGGGNVSISTFTNGTSTPAGNIGNTNPITGIDNGNGTSIGDGTSGSGDVSTGGEVDSPGNSDDGSDVVCSDEDTNITFTDDQLAQLAILQNRFYTLAQTLHNDTDVQTEVANHDAFKNKADSLLELYAYCESKQPAINADPTNDSRLKLHIATPFWRSYYNNSDIAVYVKNKTGVTIPTTDPAQDSLTFLTFDGDPARLARLALIHDNMKKSDEGDNAEVPLPTADIDQLLPGVSLIRGPYGLLTFSNPTLVPITGSALKETDIEQPVVEKFLRINLW